MTDEEILKTLSALEDEQFSEFCSYLKQLQEIAAARTEPNLTA